MPDTKTESLALEKSILRKIDSLKTTSLKEAFENYFKNECVLNNFLNNQLVDDVVFNALERCLYRVKGYQKIDTDLPDSFILEEDACFIRPKLDELRLKLADLYADILDNNTSKELDAKNSYIDIKNFFDNVYKSDISKVSFSNKLIIFDILLNLLAKKNDVTLEKFHKEFTPLFIFIKSLITKQKNLVILLEYLSNLGSEFNEVNSYSDENILAIKKYFYSIVRSLDKDKKIIDQHLLKVLTKLVKEQSNDPLKKFSIIFIEKCLNDVGMTHSDFNFVIGLVYSALKKSNSKPLKIVQNSEFFNKFKQVVGKKSFNDPLKEFEETFKELSKQTISSEILNFTSTKESFPIRTERDKFIANYFPAEESIKQAKVKENFRRSLEVLNLTNKIEEKLPINYLTKNIGKFKLINTLNSETLGKLKENIISASENLSDIFFSAAENFKVKNDLNNLSKIKDINQVSEEAKINVNSLKLKLSDFIEKLKNLENKITLFVTNISVIDELNMSGTEFSPTSLENGKDIEKNIDEHVKSFKDNYFNLSQELLNLLIGEEIKKENDWFDGNNKSSLTERLFNRGYLSGNLVIKKIKSKLDENMNFNKYKGFFERESFWDLLNYGIIRWPWSNKEIFAIKWAEQLCLPMVLDLKEQLLNFELMSEEDSLEKILSLPKYVNPDKILLFHQQLMRFRQKIIAYKSKIEVLDKEIDKLAEQAKEVIPCSHKPTFIDSSFLANTQSSSKDRTESSIPNIVKADLSRTFYNVR